MKSPTFFLLSMCFTLLILGCQTDATTSHANLNPQAATYNVQLGLAYLKQGNRQRAKQKLLTALTEDPNSPYANEAIAYYFEKTQEIEQSEYYYKKALQLAPNKGAILNNYATFLCHQEKYAEANEYFLKATKDPQYINTALAFQNAGICALEAHDTKSAKAYFQKAIAQDPSLSEANRELRRNIKTSPII